MRLWTVQPVRFLSLLRRHKRLSGCPELSEETEKLAYNWMCVELAQRLNAEVGYPVWAWHSYNGVDQPRPNLSDEWLLPKGSAGALLELNVDDRFVLLSDFEMWNWVLDNKYVPLDESDHDENKELDYTNPMHFDIIKRSWSRIFNIGCGCESFWHPVRERAVQACLPAIGVGDVVEVTRFTAK